MGRRAFDETDKRYGRLTVLHRATEEKRSDAHWLCRCECGTLVTVAGKHLRGGGTVSCGCHKKQTAGERLRRVSSAQTGELHPGWRGEDVSYGALHIWLQKNKPKSGRCEHCGQERYTEYANMTPDRRRSRDLGDWVELCKPCHMRLDGHPWVKS